MSKVQNKIGGYRKLVLVKLGTKYSIFKTSIINTQRIWDVTECEHEKKRFSYDPSVTDIRR